ncbi:MAG: CHAT domain-containing protein, partial [Prevotellaceae bacterium]|nr:CHAT domain-containing protein [Prevotellaceae bacterium]
SIRERVFGKEHPDYATSLGNLAHYNSYLGNYTEAIRLGTEALSIRERVFGKEHPDYATSLNTLTGYYDYLGNYTEAILLGTEAMEIREKVFGKEHPDYATSLNNLANCNAHMGNYSEAIRLETEAMGIYEKTLGKESTDFARSLGNLASYNNDIGNYSEAIHYGTEASEIYESVLGKEHPYYAFSLNTLANCNCYMGNYSEAIRLGAETLEIREKALGKEHPDYATSLNNLAVYTFYDGKYGLSSQYSISATQVFDKIILSTFTDLTASERAMFWDRYSDWYESSLPELAYYIQNDSLTATAYDGTLLSKGLLLNSETEMSKLLLESGDTAVVDKYHVLQGNRAVLNKLYEKPIAERRMNADSLESVIKAQEQELVRLSKVYGDYTKNLSIGWREVQEKLGEKDAAVEFLSFEALNDSVMYVALTLTKEDDVPRLVPLFEEKELDSITKSDYYTTNEISRLVWQPLGDVLRGKENIYFAPAGELHNIAVESVPCFEGEGLMSDRWSLYRLSSTRELALIKDRNELRSACVYGDLSYDMSVEDIVENGAQYASINTKRGSDWEVANIADTLSLRGAIRKLPPLPGTKAEVESVGRSLRSQNISSALLTDTAGTEASFKALNGRRTSILHLATHGFYWTESEARRKGLDAMSLLSNENNGSKYVEDKMLTRSGLFLAGADKAFDKSVKLPEGVDDGILTAKEISTLDLRGLDLVVLSACETGLGEIKGDGVFGLQRGFKKAGANTLVMSLWQVADQPTQELMSRFYQNLADGMTKYEAFRTAQGYLREKYPEPEYWAAFILLDAVD